MSNFTVDIYTPDKIVAENVPADTLLVPTVKGEVNILPDHTHLITKIDTGIMKVNRGSSGQNFLLTTGILKILGNKVTILAQVAEPDNKIDGHRAKEALSKAKGALNGEKTLSDFELVKFRRKVERAKLRIELAK